MIEFSGSRTIHGVTPEDLRALLGKGDELALVIPGCRELEVLEDGKYRVDVDAGIGAIRGRYDGTFRVGPGTHHDQLTFDVELNGPAATLNGSVRADLSLQGGATTVTYSAEGTVVGAAAGVGQRVLKTAGQAAAVELFDNVEHRLTEPSAASEAAAVGGAGSPGQTFRGPERQATVLIPAELQENWKLVAGLMVAAFWLGRVTVRVAMRRGSQ